MDAIIKYRGGKRREIPQFINFIPADYDTYIEPFLGGGAVFFQQEPNNAIINDINEPLINFYRQLATQYDRVMDELQTLHADLMLSMSALMLHPPVRNCSNQRELVHLTASLPRSNVLFQGYLPVRPASYSGQLIFPS